jgi:hypothetical protein
MLPVGLGKMGQQRLPPSGLEWKSLKNHCQWDTFWLTTLDGRLAGTSASMKRKCCSPVHIVSIANKDFGSCCMIHQCLGSSEIECEMSWYISFHLSHEEHFSKLGFSPPLTCIMDWVEIVQSSCFSRICELELNITDTQYTIP